MMMNRREKEKKVTSEKPVSLAPLSFKEALLGLLRVKPKSGAQQEGANQSNEDEDNDERGGG
jgi:hypothetical protein